MRLRAGLPLGSDPVSYAGNGVTPASTSCSSSTTRRLPLSWLQTYVAPVAPVGVDHWMVAGAAGRWKFRRGTVTRATVKVVCHVVRAVPTATTEFGPLPVVTASTVQEPKYVVVPPLTV